MSFDAVARWYRALETIAFGDALQRCRVTCLGELRAPRHALVVGEGNGRFLRELMAVCPDLQVDCVDASERMLQLARQRVANDRICFLHRDIKNWASPESRYDLVVTHFVLDCFPKAELSGVVKNLARSAKPDAVWLLGDFRVPTRGWSRLRARIWLAVMYRFFQITARIRASELIDPSPYLQAEGFSLARQHLSRNGMLKSELWRRNS